MTGAIKFQKALIQGVYLTHDIADKGTEQGAWNEKEGFRMKVEIWRKRSAFVLLLSILLLASGALYGCGGGGGGGGGGNSGGRVHLSGSIASSSGKPVPGLRLNTALTLTTTAVWAVPIAKMQGASIDKTNFMLRKTATPDADGNFSFDLQKTISLAEIVAQYPGVKTDGMPADAVFDVDWMLVQMADMTPINVISLPGDTSYDSLVSIPLSDFTQNSLNIGAVDPNSGLASFPVSSMANDVTLSTSSLQAMARADNILATIKDVIRNCDMSKSKCVGAFQSFVFMGDYSQMVSSYATATSYSGYQLYFDLTDYFTSADFDGVCGTVISGASPASTTVTPTIEYRLAPPAPITLNTGGTTTTYSSSNPMTTGTLGAAISRTTNTNNDGTGTYIDCFDRSATLNPIYLRKNVNNVNDWSLQFITGDTPDQLITDTNTGDWVLSRATSTGTATVGAFQFALANPVDGNGHPIVFVPAVRITTTGSPAAVTTVDVKWYRWDVLTSAYVEVTDTALLTSLLGSYGISLEDFDGTVSDPSRRAVRFNGNSFTTTSFDVSNPSDGKGAIYYNYSNTDKYALTYLGIDYNYGGQDFRFVWRMY